MISIEGIPIVAARLAATQKSMFAQSLRNIRRIAKVAADRKVFPVIRAVHETKPQVA